jgi:heat shock protein HslJ
MASDERTGSEAADLLVEERARSARADLERHLAPAVPDVASLRSRTRPWRLLSGGSPVDAVVAGARSRRPLVLIAAVVVLAAGIGVSFALAGSSRDSVEVTSAGGPDSTAIPLDDPNDVWGRVWDLESLTINGQAVEIPDHTGINGGEAGVPHLSLRDGIVGFVGCNGAGGPGHVEGDRLVTRGWASTAMGCGGPLGELDVYVNDFLMGGSTIELRGDHLTLRSGDGVAEFVERKPGGN